MSQQRKEIVVGILTSWDFLRMVRAVESVRHQDCDLWVEINTSDSEYAQEVKAFCKEEGIPCFRSKKTGTPGLGKQAVFKRFIREFKNEHLLLLDGDDICYPTAIDSLKRLLETQSTGVDVMALYGVDQITLYQHLPEQPGKTEIRITLAAEDGVHPALDDPPTGRSTWMWDREMMVLPCRPTFFSRRAAMRLKWDPELDCYEDALLYADSLAAHAAEELVVVNQMTQDIMVYDRSGSYSVQRTVDHKESTRQVRKKLRSVIKEEESSAGLAFSYTPPYLIDNQAKAEFIQKVYAPDNTDTEPEQPPIAETPPMQDAQQITAAGQPSFNPMRYLLMRTRFNQNSMNGLIRYCEDIGFGQATYVDGSPRENVRVRFLARAEHPAFADFFDGVEEIARLSAPLFDIDVWPNRIDAVQVARYLPGDHYGQHQDHDSSRTALEHDRKLSIFGSASPGGALEIEGETVYCNTGDVIVMSSISHHAAPVQYEGSRYSWVVWVPGPAWR